MERERGQAQPSSCSTACKGAFGLTCPAGMSCVADTSRDSATPPHLHLCPATAGDPPPSARMGRLWRSLTRRTGFGAETPFGPKEGHTPVAVAAPSPEKPGAARMQEEERRSAELSPGLDPAERLLLAEGARRLSGFTRMATRAREPSAQLQAHRLDRALHRRALRTHSHSQLCTDSPSHLPGPAVPQTAPAAAWPRGLPRTASAPSWSATPHVPMSGPLLWSSTSPLGHLTGEPAASPVNEMGHPLAGGDGLRGSPSVAAAKRSPLGLLPASASEPCLEVSQDSLVEGSAEGSSPSAGSSLDGGPSFATGVSLEPLLRSSSGLYLPWASASMRDREDGEEGESGDGTDVGVSPGGWHGLPLEARLHCIDLKQLFLGPEVAAGAFGRIFRGQYKKREVSGARTLRAGIMASGSQAALSCACYDSTLAWGE